MDLSLILFNASCRIYLFPKESKYPTVLLSINNDTQCVPLLSFWSRFMTYAYLSSKLFIEKSQLSLGLSLKHLVILILIKGWSGAKIFIYRILIIISSLCFFNSFSRHSFYCIKNNFSQVLEWISWKAQKYQVNIIFPSTFWIKC